MKGQRLGGGGGFLWLPGGLLKMFVNQACQQSAYAYYTCSSAHVWVMRIEYSTDSFNNKTTNKDDEKKGIELAVNVKLSIPWGW